MDNDCLNKGIERGKCEIEKSFIPSQQRENRIRKFAPIVDCSIYVSACFIEIISAISRNVIIHIKIIIKAKINQFGT